MKKNEIADLIEGSYLLPWGKDNNPNGWIEPTTFCQLKCPGCYRGLDQDNREMIHEDFEEMKSQIDKLVETRNIQTLSVAGGEPLLYPKLKEVVVYAREKGLRVMIYTNGLALDENKLREMKESGVTQIVLHIDGFQGRDGYANETGLMKLRENYCNLFRKVKGVNLGFIQPLSKKNLEEVNLLLPFYRENVDVVNLVVFTLYREVCWDHEFKPEIDTDITMEEVVAQIKKEDFYSPCAYLGATGDISQPTWLFSVMVGTTGQKLGFLDGKMYQFIQERYFKNRKKYLFLARKNRVNIIKLFRYFNFKCIRKIIGNYFRKNLFTFWGADKQLYFQTMLILRGPEKRGDAWDLCEGCPDAMFYKGRLVPSCILEEIKKKDK